MQRRARGGCVDVASVVFFSKKLLEDHFSAPLRLCGLLCRALIHTNLQDIQTEPVNSVQLHTVCIRSICSSLLGLLVFSVSCTTGFLWDCLSIASVSR